MNTPKYYFIFIIFLIFIFTSSCSSKSSVKNEEGKFVKAESANLLRNDKVNKSENTGKIEVSNDNVYYVINWESRSRVTLKVTGNLRDEIKKLNGKIIEAAGKITKESTWSGTIEIESYKIKE